MKSLVVVRHSLIFNFCIPASFALGLFLYKDCIHELLEVRSRRAHCGVLFEKTAVLSLCHKRNKPWDDHIPGTMHCTAFREAHQVFETFSLRCKRTWVYKKDKTDLEIFFVVIKNIFNWKN